MKEIVIVGYGGHAYVVIEACKALGCDIVGYCDQEEKAVNPFDIMYLGQETPELISAYEWILGIGDNTTRRIVFNKLADIGRCTSIIHPQAIVSQSATIGIGSFLSAGSIINAFAKIGTGSIINSGAIVEHECILGDFVHIAPGAVLAGNVTIGDNTFIGANAVVRQGISIGSNVIIGAGAVVVKDVPSNCTLVGNPARPIKS